MALCNPSIEEFLRNYPSTHRNKIDDDDSDDDDNTHLSSNWLNMNDPTIVSPSLTTTTQPVNVPKITSLDLIEQEPLYEFYVAIAGSMQLDIDDIFSREELERRVNNAQQMMNERNGKVIESERQGKELEKLNRQLGKLRNEQLVIQHESDTLKKVERLLNKLDKIIGPYEFKPHDNDNPSGYLITVLNNSDYELVLSDNIDRESLISFLDRNERVNDRPAGTFTKYEDDQLKLLSLFTLWDRDYNPDKRRSYDEKDDVSFPDSILNKLDVLEKGGVPNDNITPLRNEALKIDTYMVDHGEDGSLNLVGENKAIKLAVKQEKTVTPNYYGIMDSLFSLHNDPLRLNNLLKGINLTTMHSPVLNQRIQRLANPSTALIIDTSKRYFKELYYMSNTVVDQFDDIDKSKDKLGAIRNDLDNNRNLLRSLVDLYRDTVTSILEEIFTVYTKEGSTILDQQELHIPIPYNDITNKVIKDTLFRETYVNHIKDKGGIMNMITTTPIDPIYMARLFTDLPVYVNERAMDIRNAIVKSEESLNQLNRPLVTVVIEDDGDDDGDVNNWLDKKSNKRRKRDGDDDSRTNLMIKPSIRDKIDEAYQLIMTWCPGLYNLPLKVIQESQSSKTSGLMGDFARFVAVLNADDNLLYPDNYKAKAMYEKISMKKSEAMERIKLYSYNKRSNGYNTGSYNIIKKKKSGHYIPITNYK